MLGGDGAGSTNVSCVVTNVGSTAGTEVPQLYLTYPAAAGEPPRQLKAFAKMKLEAGESRRAVFTLTKRDFAVWNGSVATGGWAIVPGEFGIEVGASSCDVRLTGTINVAAER